MLVLDIPRRSPPHFAYIDVPVYHRLHLALTESIPAYAYEAAHPHFDRFGQH